MPIAGRSFFSQYVPAALLAVAVLPVIGCVPGATGALMSPPTAPVNHAAVHPTRVKKMGGDISLTSAPSGAELLTMGGNISIKRADGFVAATTMGGDIDIDSLDGGAHLVSNGGSVRLLLRPQSGHEPRDLDLTVRGGNVHLIIADPVSAQFEIRLGYGRDQDGQYAINSDFPLTEVKSDWKHTPSHLFQAHQQIDASGTVGTGSDRIHIHVEGGAIYLTRTS
jgi:hypothetical protein